jgi:hypothetical protein
LLAKTRKQACSLVSTPIVAQMDELFAVDAEARRKTLLGSPQAGPRQTLRLSFTTRLATEHGRRMTDRSNGLPEL